MRRRCLIALAGLGAACGSQGGTPRVEQTARRCPGAPISEMGVATYYDADGDGSCSFDASADHMVAALNAPDYARAAWCGACLAVAGPLGEVIVRVVDQCPACKHGDLDLSHEAFAQIAPLSDGRAPIAWREVECPVTGPLVYQRKPGSNDDWTAFQLRNHRYAIARLEARDARGTYQVLTRTDDNYFVGSGLGPGPYALRVSDIHGHTLEDHGIALAAAAVGPGAAQFPACR